MRRTWFQKSLFQKSFRSLLRSIAAGIVLGLSPAIFAADAADSTAAKSAAAAAKSMSQSLRHVLDGAAPSGVSDLRTFVINEALHDLPGGLLASACLGALFGGLGGAYSSWRREQPSRMDAT